MAWWRWGRRMPEMQIAQPERPIVPLVDRRKSSPHQRDAWAAQREFERRLEWLEAQVTMLLQRDREA